MSNKSIPHTPASLRLAAGYPSQKDLAASAGVAAPQVARIERGEDVRHSVFFAVRDCLDVSTDVLRAAVGRAARHMKSEGAA